MKLRDYLSRHEITPATFAAKLGVSRVAVVRWMNGNRYPAQHFKQIAAATKGLVTPLDFYDIKPAKKRRAK